jgi:hypothetical protein
VVPLSSRAEPLVGLVDESIDIPGRRCYIVAAVIIAQGDKADVRRALRGMLPPGRSFHNRAEKEGTRRAVLQLIGGVARSVFIYRCIPAPDGEKARDACFAAMWPHLRSRPVAELIIDSRETNDGRDRSRLIAAGQKGHLSPDLRYAHVRAHGEPLLWLADALAGAALAEFRGRRTFLGALRPDLLTRIDLT